MVGNGTRGRRPNPDRRPRVRAIGRGVGTNPEELLVSAVSSCYTATLFGVLNRAKLPVDSLVVKASGTVTGLPGRARFAGIVVTPTILGGDLVRQREYEAAARGAHD